jgi:hypothetical protein
MGDARSILQLLKKIEGKSANKKLHLGQINMAFGFDFPNKIHPVNGEQGCDPATKSWIKLVKQTLYTYTWMPIARRPARHSCQSQQQCPRGCPGMFFKPGSIFTFLWVCGRKST